VSATDLKITAAASALTLGVLSSFTAMYCWKPSIRFFYRATGGRGGLVHLGILALTVLNLVAALQTMGIVLALGLFCCRR